MDPEERKEILALKALIQKEPTQADHPFALGLVYLRQEDHQAAMQAFKESLRLDPERPETHFNLGFCFQRLGFEDSALASYQDCLTLNPSDAAAWTNLGSIYLKRGLNLKAFLALEEAVEQSPSQPLWAMLAMAAYPLKEHQRALEAVEAFLEEQPHDLWALEQKGLNLLALGQAAAALKAYDQALAQGPAKASLYNNRANARLALGQQVEALEDYRQGVKLDPGAADIWFNLGEALQGQNAWAEAIQALDRVIELEPEDQEAREKRVQCLAQTEPAKAIRELSQMLEQGQRQPHLTHLLAELYQKAGQQERAFSLRCHLAESHPQHQENNFALALFYLAQGRLEEAMELLLLAKAEAEEMSQVWWHLSQNFRASGAWQKEMDSLQRLLALSPRFAPAWLRLGHLAAREGLWERALQYLERSQGLGRPDWRLWLRLFLEIYPNPKAEACLNQLKAHLAFRPEILAPILRFLAERGDWSLLHFWSRRVDLNRGERAGLVDLCLAFGPDQPAALDLAARHLEQGLPSQERLPRLARLAKLRGKAPQAQELLARHLHLSACAEAAVTLALEQLQPEKALAILEKATMPTSLKACWQAQAWEQLSQSQAWASALDQAQGQDFKPNLLPGLQLRQALLQQDLEQGQAILAGWRSRQGESGEYLKAKALWAARSGHFSLARWCWRKALVYLPQDPLIHHHLRLLARRQASC